MLVIIPATVQAQLSFNLIHDPGMSAQALAGFQMAANRWSGVLRDPVTVSLQLGFTDMGESILGGTSSVGGTLPYEYMRLALAFDATSQADLTAFVNLPSTPSVDMLINRTVDNPNGAGSATPYVDADGGANNSTIRLTLANARALGLYDPAGGLTDAFIDFNSRFNFDFDPTDGIDADAIDFVGVATHEIGHALGFMSGVDILDQFSPPTAGPFFADEYTYVSPLDLFRYSAESRAEGRGVIDFTADARVKYFSLDGGDTAIAPFATGSLFGDGRQASHWKDHLGLGILDPTAGAGERLAITGLDLVAMDVIGWDLAPIPEPSTYGLIGAGVLLGAAALRRRPRSRRQHEPAA